jgi:hypothetical protein
MKNIFSVFLILLLSFSLCGCGHKHVVGEWTVDEYSHWYVCDECKEKINYEDHVYGKDEKCLVCGAYKYGVIPE